MTKPIISTLLNGNILIITNNKNYEISEKFYDKSYNAWID